MTLVLSPLVLVAGLGVLVVLGVVRRFRIPMKGRNLLVVLVGFVVIAVVVFDWSGLVFWSHSAFHALHVSSH